VSVSLSDLLDKAERYDRLRERVEFLERAVLLLANHVGAVGWNHDLQQALDKLREAQR
jgi:hypothetical protein